ncbi:hypothetical protein [Mesobacillus zeae]|uniref:hypothetical protein n=1 Tax=Mesobacillus zeae TaxID=1917180 RepID=UPI003009316C
MKKKIIVGVVTVSLLAGTGLYSYNQRVLAKEAAQIEQIQIEKLENAERAVDSLYNSKRTMLAGDLKTKLKKAEIAVSKVEKTGAKERLSKEIRQVKKIAKVQQEVYGTLKNGVLIKNVTLENLKEINQSLITIKSQNERIYAYLAEYLSEANSQLTAIDTALNKVKEAEKSLDRKMYNNALKLVNKVKNPVKREELSKKLEQVNTKLVAMEEERLAAEKATSEKLATEQHQSAVPSNSKQPISSSSAPSNNSSNGSVSSNPKANSSTGSNNSNYSGTTSDGSSSETNWDEAGKNLEDHDWSNSGSGEIGTTGNGSGNTWDSWN